MSAAFRGPLAVQFGEFATLIKTTGGRHTSLLATVGSLDRFLATCFPEATTLTKVILAAWFASFDHLQPASRRRYRSATFQVCKFLRRRDPATGSIDDFEPLRCPRSFHPYIFSAEEVIRLLTAARGLAARSADPMRPWSAELVITLLYTAGLRIGEVVRLQVRDYDTTNATLTIRETKFAKTRLVPVSRSARKIIDEYLTRRQRLGLSCIPDSPLRCCPSNHSPCVRAVQSALADLMRQCGIKPPRGRGPLKRGDSRRIDYLTTDEIAAVLLQIPAATPEGRRHDALLRFLYNTGARVQEAIDVRANDLYLDSPAHVLLRGKGRKERICPLWTDSVDRLRRLLAEHHLGPMQPSAVFTNRDQRPLTRFGVRYILTKYVRAAVPQCPSLARKNVHPHSVRHATAMHLLQSGVDLNTIRCWLGHASVTTTNQYVEIDLEMKRCALERVSPPPGAVEPATNNSDLLAWLESL